MQDGSGGPPIPGTGMVGPGDNNTNRLTRVHCQGLLVPKVCCIGAELNWKLDELTSSVVNAARVIRNHILRVTELPGTRSPVARNLHSPEAERSSPRAVVTLEF